MEFHYSFRRIEEAAWSRRKHFEVFGRRAFPYCGVTTPVEVADWRAKCRDRGWRFFPAFLHAVATAANAVENFRYRMDGDQIVLCERIDPSWTVLEPSEGLPYFATTEWMPDIAAFCEAAATASRRAAVERNLVNDRADVFYASSTPWFEFTDVLQPLDLSTGDAIPRIVWGRWREEDGGRCVLSLSITAHHGFIDGWHMARFLECLQQHLRNA